MKQPERSAFYQGQLDVFCAAYAVLNALRLLHGLRPLEARLFLHEALRDIARDPIVFQTALDQRTDYVEWVDAMLERQIRRGGLCVHAPFARAPRPGLGIDGGTPSPWRASGKDNAGAPEQASGQAGDAPGPDPETLWRTLTAWLTGGEARCALFQFIRFAPVGHGLIRHWTCCSGVEDEELVLYDCSREPGALTRIARCRLITDETARAAENVLIPPHTARLIRSRLVS